MTQMQKITAIKPKDTKELLNSLAGFYFQMMTYNANEENDHTLVMDIKLSLENFVDMQQFIILYTLLLQNNGIHCDFDFIIKYQDGYGVNGRWMRQPATIDSTDQLLIDNVVNTNDDIIQVLHDTGVTFFNSPLLDPAATNQPVNPLNRLLTQEEFMHHLLNMSDFQTQITHYVDLGWQHNQFIFNEDVKEALTSWTKHYSPAIIDTYAIIMDHNQQNTTRILIPEKDRKYLFDKKPELLPELANQLLNHTLQLQHNVPLWTKFDYRSQQLRVDPSKY